MRLTTLRNAEKLSRRHVVAEQEVPLERREFADRVSKSQLRARETHPRTYCCDLPFWPQSQCTALSNLSLCTPDLRPPTGIRHIRRTSRLVVDQPSDGGYLKYRPLKVLAVPSSTAAELRERDGPRIHPGNIDAQRAVSQDITTTPSSSPKTPAPSRPNW